MSIVRYSEEPFLSVQGEGKYTGELCTWIRMFSCNLQCAGFSQPDPTDPTTYIKPISFDPKQVKSLADIPTPKYGCDSAYSVSAAYKHLASKSTPKQLADKVVSLLPFKLFQHPNKPNKIGHVFTGGEPLLQQDAIVDIVEYWISIDNYPHRVTFETNGTQQLTNRMKLAIAHWAWIGIEVVFSISPKLHSVSGEKKEKAIKPDVIKQLIDHSTTSYLKFVVNDNEKSWQEACDVVESIKPHSTQVWAMPVGGVFEQQSNPDISKLADKAIFEYGWHLSTRSHILVWGNDQMGR